MLTISTLGYAFQHQKLFENFSCTIAAGELLHLSGPNGVGKSTLLTIVSGLRRPQLGTVAVAGDSKAATRRAKTCYLPAESYGHYFELSAWENLALWTDIGALATVSAYEQALKRWGLASPRLAKVPVRSFSSGMKKRLALARVELGKQKIWLLDEPLNGLDCKGTATFQALLAEHLSSGGLGIIVSHEIEAIAKLVTMTRELRCN